MSTNNEKAARLGSEGGETNQRGNNSTTGTAAQAHRATRFAEELHRCPHAGSGVHCWIMTCANLAAIARLNPMEAERAIIQTMPRRPSPASEVSTAIRKAYAETMPGGTESHYTPQRAPKPKTLPMTAAAFIKRGNGAEECDWWEASPIRIDWEPGPQDALAILGTLYAPGEFVFCGERYGADVKTAGDWIARIEGGAPVPPHWIPNPLTGEEHPTGNGKPSKRGDSAVCGFRYAVAEFDGLSKADQLAFWWGFRTAPIVALIDSGGKSVHAILKVDCATRADWEKDVEETLFPCVLCPLGCDPACRNESRLSRLPGHFRREKKTFQRLLYLNPEGVR